MTRQPGTYAIFDTTEGKIVCRLFEKEAPITTKNFTDLAEFGDETKGSSYKFDKAGKLAMANAGPGTNGSQFFITVAATPWLTGNHTIFGEVVEGQDIADKISKLKKGAQDRPVKDVVINSITIERA
jgi:peptidyl-prolyl cis-trans isomerase A (cyclophilin A)